MVVFLHFKPFQIFPGRPTCVSIEIQSTFFHFQRVIFPVAKMGRGQITDPQSHKSRLDERVFVFYRGASQSQSASPTVPNTERPPPRRLREQLHREFPTRLCYSMLVGFSPLPGTPDPCNPLRYPFTVPQSDHKPEPSPNPSPTVPVTVILAKVEVSVSNCLNPLWYPARIGVGGVFPEP